MTKFSTGSSAEARAHPSHGIFGRVWVRKTGEHISGDEDIVGRSTEGGFVASSVRPKNDSIFRCGPFDVDSRFRLSPFHEDFELALTGDYEAKTFVEPSDRIDFCGAEAQRLAGRLGLGNQTLNK